MDENKKRSPWGQAAQTENLSPEEKAVLENIDKQMISHPPVTEPTDWEGVSSERVEQLREVNCALNHIFNIAGFTLQEKLTYLAEKMGSIIGDHAATPEAITSTVAAFAKPTVRAAQVYYRDLRINAAFEKLLRPHTTPEGKPN